MRPLLLILALFATLAPVRGQPALPDAVTPAQARNVLDMLKDDKRRGEFEATLDAIVHAEPAPKPSVVPLAADSVGAELLVQGSRWAAELGSQLTATAEAVGDVPLLGRWVVATASDDAARTRIADTAWRLVVALMVARGTEWLAGRILARPRRLLTMRAPADEPETDEPALPSDGLTAAEAGETELQVRHQRFSVAWRMLRRLPFVLAALVLELLPVAAFAAVGNAVLATPLGNTTNTRLVILACVNAWVVCRVIMSVARTFVSPTNPRLRLIHCDDATASTIERWVRRISGVAVFGFATAEIGLLFGLYRTAHDVLLKLFSLAVHIMLVVVVIQSRKAVAHRLRARRRSGGIIAGLQNHLASQWHIIAIFYIVALWLVAAAEIKDGYTRLLHFFVVTTGTIILARLASIVILGGLDRAAQLSPADTGTAPAFQQRILRYYPVIRTSLAVLLGAATIVMLLEAWGYSPVGWFTDAELGERLLSALVTSGVTLALALLIWEGANATVESHLAGLTRQAQLARAARLRTLLPMLRTALLVAIVLIAGLIVLSQIGINIAPLLAGAGVLGVAIGFGSQKLVQDLITGLFLLLENTMQVGDVVTLAGLSGTVENLSIRTIRLRALDGAVHIIPFSSVTTVTNQTRDYAYALVDLEVGLNEEPDEIGVLLQNVAKAMRCEPRWQDAITADLEVMGVQAFGDNAWTMRVRLRTTPAQRWAVTREFNRRVKYRFDELAIQSPLTAYKAQGWMPPGSERPMPKPDAPIPAAMAAPIEKTTE